MAQLANCPHCEHELLIPEGTTAGTSVRCPSCHELFQLSDSRQREIAAVEIIEPAPGAAERPSHSEPTIASFSSRPTWEVDEPLDDLNSPAPEESQRAIPGNASELDDTHEAGKPQQSAEIDFDDFDAMLDDREAVEVDDANTRAFEPSQRATGEPMPRLEAAESHEPHSSELEAEPTKTPEAAAERIDAWFKSAKTLADIPAVEEPAVHYHTPDSAEQVQIGSGADEAKLDTAAREEDEIRLDEDFDIDDLDQDQNHITPDAPAWDDSQHIDELLADFQDKAHNDQSDRETAAAESELHPAGEPIASATGAEWKHDESMKMSPPSDNSRRKRSLVRTLLMTTTGGLVGLILGYYALLWIRGPEIDVLEAGKFLPKVLLPSSFSKQTAPPRQLAAAPAKPSAEEPATEPATEPTSTTGADGAAQTAAAETSHGDSPAEQPASFTEPVDPKKTESLVGNRYSAATAADKAAEPAAFNAPAAEPMKDTAAAVHIKLAPTFAAADLAAAIEAGKSAQAGLVNGNLTDGRPVQRTKGASYSVLADLAEKVTLTDAASSPEMSKLQHDGTELLRNTLATPHAREEVAKIVPMWISSPNRRNGGIFFAGSVVASQAQGAVTQCNIDLGGGQSLPVLVSPSLAEPLRGSSAPVAVVGWIVDNPAENVEGYTGKTTQAVYAAKLITLE